MISTEHTKQGAQIASWSKSDSVPKNAELMDQAMKNQFNVAVIVPCFNEETAIAHTVQELSERLSEFANFEIIVVNDGSTDNSATVVDALGAGGKFPGLRIIHHPVNRGYGAALKSGIRAAKMDLIAITDADGTYPLARLKDLVSASSGADMVVGSRTGGNVVYSTLRKIPKSVLKAWVCWLVRQDVPDINSGMRVFKKSVAERFLRVLPDSFSFTTTITIALMHNGFIVRFVPIDYAARLGKSKIKPIHDTLNFVQLILRTGLYFAPLRALKPLIVLLFLLFLASLTYDVAILRNLTDKTVMLLFATMDTVLFALLADMIDKRTNTF
jgi:glycosyltransferase involved in cell wall biosynthesis